MNEYFFNWNFGVPSELQNFSRYFKFELDNMNMNVHNGKHFSFSPAYVSYKIIFQCKSEPDLLTVLCQEWVKQYIYCAWILIKSV